jgi:hypothetical protein
VIGTRQYGEEGSRASEQVISDGRRGAGLHTGTETGPQGRNATTGPGDGHRRVRPKWDDNEEFALSLKRLANRFCPRQAAVALSHEPGAQPRKTLNPLEDTQASAKPSGEQAAEEVGPESNHGDSSGESMEPEVVVGSLRTAQEDRCAGRPRAPRAFTASKIAKSFAVWSQRIA